MQIKTIWHTGCLLLLLSGVACSHVDEVTPRSYVGLLVGDTKLLRDEIAQELSSGKAVPTGVLGPKLPNNSLMKAQIDFGWVTAGGTIIVRNDKYDVVVIQEPSVSQGVVAWNCVVYPAKAKPNICESAR